MILSFRRCSAEERPRRGALRELFAAFLRKDSRHVRRLRLLRSWLSPEQRAQFNQNNYFDVTGCYTGKRYRIHHGVTTNVTELDDGGRPVAGLCFLPMGNLVAGDVMLTQKLPLRRDEKGVLAVAKSFSVPTDLRCLISPAPAERRPRAPETWAG